jgi:16S rRNA (guanine527-N7)-methyltransferase
MTKVKHISNLFSEAIQAVGLELPDGMFDLLIEHYLLLEKWNSTFNLTSLVNPEDIIDRLYIDSLLFHLDLPHETLEIYDFGSGPGFPGIPLLIMRPESRLIIVEPKQRMASFLAEVRYVFSDKLLFDVISERCDTPEFIRSHQDTISVAVSKAFAPPDAALKLLAPLLRPGGIYATCVNVGTEFEHPPERLAIRVTEHIHSLPLTRGKTRHLIFQRIPSD